MFVETPVSSQCTASARSVIIYFAKTGLLVRRHVRRRLFGSELPLEMKFLLIADHSTITHRGSTSFAFVTCWATSANEGFTDKRHWSTEEFAEERKVHLGGCEALLLRSYFGKLID